MKDAEARVERVQDHIAASGVEESPQHLATIVDDDNAIAPVRNTSQQFTNGDRFSLPG